MTQNTPPDAREHHELERGASVDESATQGTDSLPSREAEPSGWRPIDSAPKDGTRVDLWISPRGLSTGPGRVSDCWFSSGEWRCDDAFGPDGYSAVYDATAWMPPPPAPPAESGASSQDGAIEALSAHSPHRMSSESSSPHELERVKAALRAMLDHYGPPAGMVSAGDYRADHPITQARAALNLRGDSLAAILERRLAELLVAVKALVDALPDQIVVAKASEVERVCEAIEALSESELIALKDQTHGS